MRAAVIGPGGIGSEVVRALQARGHEVVVGWHESPAAAVELGVPGVHIDVTDPSSCKEFFATVWRDVGPLDGVVNCFGVTEEAPVLGFDSGLMDRALALNLTGIVHVCRAVAFRLMKAGGGAIVNIGSVVSELGMPGLSAYAAGKGGLVSFGRALAAELAPYGVTCNAVLPGFIDAGTTLSRSSDWKDAVARHIPLGRLGTAAEVAALAVHLLSPEARYVTGQPFVIDGGLSLGSAALVRDLVEAGRD